MTIRLKVTIKVEGNVGYAKAQTILLRIATSVKVRIGSVRIGSHLKINCPLSHRPMS